MIWPADQGHWIICSQSCQRHKGFEVTIVSNSIPPTNLTVIRWSSRQKYPSAWWMFQRN